ncbi:MAG TPA: hypothetical protein PKG52_06580 [bacterium]|nr:hypothetical protein [bacterium]HPS30462.1 hypothetical protein [bacterium]
MKKITSLILILIIFTYSFGVEAKKPVFGGWGTPALKFTSLGDKNPFSKNSDFALLLTLRGGFILNNFIIGGSGSILTNPISYNCKKAGVSYEDYSGDSDGWGGDGTEACNDFKDPDLDFFYAGIFLGYTFQVTKIFKIEALDFFGFGSINGGDYGFLDAGETYDQDFFIMEPEISFLFVIAKFFAISLNMSYRIPAMLENEHDHYSSWDISGPSMGFDLRFGYFNYKDSP